MAWKGGKLQAGQRKKPVILLTLLFILTSACAALGMSLYGAKLAHGRLWQRFKEQELKLLQFHQSMAEVKVESVDVLTEKMELRDQRDTYLNMQRNTATALQERDQEVVELKAQLETAEARVAELERRLSNRQTEAHVLKKALDQYKHQIANLTQELDILRGRMKKAGIIQEAHSVLPHQTATTATSGGGGSDSIGSGDETLKAFEAEQARMVASEAELGLQSTAEDDALDAEAAAKAVTTTTTTTTAAKTASTNLDAREAAQRAKAEAEAAASTQAVHTTIN